MCSITRWTPPCATSFGFRRAHHRTSFKPFGEFVCLSIWIVSSCFVASTAAQNAPSPDEQARSLIKALDGGKIKTEETFTTSNRLIELGKKDARASESIVSLMLRGSSTCRELAPRIIGEIGENAVAPVMKELAGENPKTLVIAMNCIEALKLQAQTCEARLLLLLRHKEASVRGRAAETLGRVKAKSAIPALVALVQHEESWDVLVGLAIAFREFGQDSKEALPALMKVSKKALQEERDGEFHGVTLPLFQSALSAIGKPAAPGIIAMLEDETSPANSKGFAMRVLWGIADQGYGAAAAAGIPGLLRALRNGELSGLDAEDTAKTLAAIGPDAKAYAAQIDAASEKGNSYLQILLAYAAARADPAKTKGIARLRKFLTDKDAAGFRWVTADKLGELGPVAREALDDLKKLENDPTPVVRIRAAMAIQRINKK